MNIYCLGSRSPLAQITRIELGLMSLGHNVVYPGSKPDLIYCNDAGYYDEAINYRERFGGKLILNVLDIPVHCWQEIDYEKAYLKLINADKITCISKTVQKHIKKYLNLDSEVIYNPIKDIYNINNSGRKEFVFGYAGRACDPNKRFNIAYEAVNSLTRTHRIQVAGPENPNNYGISCDYRGILSDAEISNFYYSCKYILLPSKLEGLGLSAFEGAICGCIPILCGDNETAHEFWPKEFISDNQYPIPYSNVIINCEKYYNDYKKLALEYGEKYRKLLDKKQIASNIINVFDTIK